jgi:hypothetical protein
VAALLFAAFVALDRLAAARSARWAAAAGSLFGLAVAAKGVAAVFAPLGAVFLVVRARRDRRGLRWLAAAVAAMTAGAWIAVLAAYGFSGFPLPAPLVEGVRFQLAASSAGEFPAFLNGEWSQRGWWYYYLVALGLKTPVPTLVFLLAGFMAMARRRWRGSGDLWIALPPLLLLYFLSFHYGKNYGIRYVIPALPFLLLLAGVGFDAMLQRTRSGAVCAALLLAWQLVACTVGSPHHLAYFNELAGGGDRARRLLLDSNLDWGQDLGRLKEYLDERGLGKICLGYFGHVDPHLYGIDYTLPPASPVPGRCAVSANFLAGYPYAVTYGAAGLLPVPPGAWSWFDRFRPVERIGRSIYVFEITAADVRSPP